MARTLRLLLPLLALVLVAAGGTGVTTETRDVVGQGSGGPVVSAGGATLKRSDQGLSVRLGMPTPIPGSYTYPPANPFLPAAVPGHPEAYTLWAFVFNHPELCSGPCDSDDIGPTDAQGGVYNAAGHVVGGGTLVLSGHISVGQATFGGVPLSMPRTAEVHIAVAPHGAVDPALMPDQITKPLGSPSLWWLAIFD